VVSISDDGKEAVVRLWRKRWLRRREEFTVRFRTTMGISWYTRDCVRASGFVDRAISNAVEARRAWQPFRDEPTFVELAEAEDEKDV